MRLAPTSITLFLVQIATFFSGLIVVVCCCLYVSAYPKSQDAGSLSPIAIGTLSFALLSSLMTLNLILRQKYGKTMRAILESIWIIFATAMWVLAAVGGIISPPNGMSNVSCKLVSNGTEIADSNYKRACQSMFASTAFCIATALLFVATAVLLFVYSVKRSIRDRKSKKATVGGHYKLGPSPSQYRRTQQSSQDDEESKTLKGAGEHEEDQRQQNYKDDEESLHGTGGRNNDIREGHFSDNVYQDPVISTPAAPYHPGNTYSGGHYPTNQSYSQYSHPQ